MEPVGRSHTDSPSRNGRSDEAIPSERLDAWKEIAAYLGRSERTVRRWEVKEGLPVHRLQHEKRGSVYAYRQELDAWWESKRHSIEPQPMVKIGPANGNSDGQHSELPRRRWVALGVGIVACLGAVWWLGGRRVLDGRVTPASIAVLPFVSLGSDSDVGYLSDGITEEITNSLSRIPGLRIAARSSALRFKGGNADVREIGRKLGVSAVLEGSVRATGDRLRIAAQLVNAADGYQLWSETYDRGASEISVVQDSITKAVAGNLGLNVAGERAASVRGGTGVNGRAYNLVLKARYLNSLDADGKIECYRKALEYAPDYAEAYSGLAGEWTRLVVQGSVAPRELMEKARSAADKAIHLDESQPDAHFIMALIKWAYDWDWPAAEREFERALQLNPSSATMRVLYSRYLVLLGRRQEALTQLERIRVLDPNSGELRAIEAAVYYFTRDYERTIAHVQTVLAGEPKFWLLYYWMGRAYDSKGLLPDAIVALEKWHGIPGSLQGRGFGMLGSVYARAGRRDDALRLLESAVARSKDTYVAPSSIALVHFGLGDLDRGFEWLEKAYAERDHSLVSLKAEPAYDLLRGHPRFTALLRRMKLD